jgi:hypothetical protein
MPNVFSKRNVYIILYLEVIWLTTETRHEFHHNSRNSKPNNFLLDTTVTQLYAILLTLTL